MRKLFIQSVSYTDDWEEKHHVFPKEVERMTFGLPWYVSETSLKDVGEQTLAKRLVGKTIVLLLESFQIFKLDEIPGNFRFY